MIIQNHSIMRASLSKVCLSPYYTLPTQTFRYYPGYPYTVLKTIRLKQPDIFFLEINWIRFARVGTGMGQGSKSRPVLYTCECRECVEYE